MQSRRYQAMTNTAAIVGVFVLACLAKPRQTLAAEAGVQTSNPFQAPRSALQADAADSNTQQTKNASRPAAARSVRGRCDNGSECASRNRRVAPSRVFSELKRSAQRLVALDPIARRMRRILVAKRSPSRLDHSSAIPIGAGRGANCSSS